MTSDVGKLLKTFSRISRQICEYHSLNYNHVNYEYLLRYLKLYNFQSRRLYYDAILLFLLIQMKNVSHLILISLVFQYFLSISETPIFTATYIKYLLSRCVLAANCWC